MKSLTYILVSLFFTLSVNAAQKAEPKEKTRAPADAEVRRSEKLAGWVNITSDDSIANGRIIQIIDKTNNVVCYGMDNTSDGRSISCVKY